MAQETTATTDEGTTTRTSLGRKHGAFAGFTGGAVMGIMLTMQMRGVIAAAIPAMYGFNGLAMGWIIHLFHATVLGVVFVAIVQTDTAAPYVASVGKPVVSGTVYGVGLWIILAALVMPVWLSMVGFSGAPPLPNFNPMSLVGHVVYGAVVGAVYGVIEG